MGQIYSNQSGSVKGYYVPPIPGANGIFGNSVALAYAQGARTPVELATQTAIWYVKSIAMIIIVVAILLLIQSFRTPAPAKQKFRNIQGLEESAETLAPAYS